MEAVLAFIAANLPIILCLLVGIALVTVEIFLPGFGLPGITGLCLLIGAIVLTWVTYGALAGLAMTLVMLALAGIVISVSIKSAASGRLSRSSLILKGKEETPAADEMEELVGKEGITATMLRPAGIAVFDGVRLSVVSAGQFIEKGKPVRIVKAQGAQITVEEIAA